MRLEVPFYSQEINECGPVALQMVFEYFGEEHDREKLKGLVESIGELTWTSGLAKTSAQLGFPTEFYSIALGFNPKLFDLEYYQKDGAQSAEDKIKRLYANCLEYGVKLEERCLTLEEIVSKIGQDCIPIVLIDWGKINSAEKFIGHFVPIVGYDEKNIYVHNSGPEASMPNYPIERSLFETARKSVGTDEDILFIYKKQ